MAYFDALQLCCGRRFHDPYWRFHVMCFDWAIALLTLSAGSAALGVIMANNRGRPLQNFSPCHGAIHHTYSNFCTLTKVASIFSIVTFALFLPHLLLSTAAYIISYYEH
eukprot:SM000006S19332  [mRNA]  locus=s6:16490:17177:- [translate_table: standard]